MRHRTAAATAVLLAALLAACGGQPRTQVASAASVTVNGNDAKLNVVKCTQVQWYRTINIGSDKAGATVRVDGRGAQVLLESVRVQNLGGFTGMYSRGGGDDANISLNGEKYTISGTANGYMVDKPNEPASATFKITVAC